VGGIPAAENVREEDFFTHFASRVVEVPVETIRHRIPDERKESRGAGGNTCTAPWPKTR
jgi:hypothetical protein